MVCSLLPQYEHRKPRLFAWPLAVLGQWVAVC